MSKAVALFFFLVSLATSSLYADDLQQEIDQLKKKIQELEKRVKSEAPKTDTHTKSADTHKTEAHDTGSASHDKESEAHDKSSVSHDKSDTQKSESDDKKSEHNESSKGKKKLKTPKTMSHSSDKTETQEETLDKKVEMVKLYLKHPTAEVSLFLGGTMQCDAYFFVHTDEGDSTWLIRRARLIMGGEIQKFFIYEAEFAWDREKDIRIDHILVETKWPGYFRVRTGLFKEPFSREVLYSNLFETFDELSLGGINFAPKEDLGIGIFGDFMCGFIDYQLGIFNGRGRDIDNNNNKQIAGRIVINPFAFTCVPFLEETYIGFSGVTGRRTEDLKDFKFVTGTEFVFWDWEEGVSINDYHNDWGIDIEWFNGPLVIRAEYLNADWGIVDKAPIGAIPARHVPFKVESGYAYFAYLLTGEDEPRNAPIIPFRDFSICNPLGGAWEVAARYQVLHINEEPLNEGFAIGANRAHGPTFALNWYLNPYICIKANWTILHFNREIPVKDKLVRGENEITIRTQVVF